MSSVQTLASARLLLHNDVSAHKAKVTVTLLHEQNVRVLLHSPDSPDQAPCDFWLSTVIKDRLAGQLCSRNEDPAKAVQHELRALAPPD